MSDNEVLNREEAKIAQELNDRLNSNPEYLQNILNKTVEVSQTLYQKSPMKSQLIENKAKLIDENLLPILRALDQNIYKTVQVYNNKVQSLQSEYKNQKSQISEKIVNSVVVKKTNEYNNHLINTLEQQLTVFGDYLRQKQIDSPRISDQKQIVEGENGIQQEQKVLKRYIQLVNNVKGLTFAIYSSYFQNLQQTQVYQKFLEAKIFQEILVELCNERVITPINTNLVKPQVDRALVLKTQSYEFLNKQQEFLLQRYIETKKKIQDELEAAKVKCTVQLENTKKQVLDIIPLIQNKYEVLKGQAVQIQQDYFTISFCKEFYAKNQDKIVEALNSMKTQIEQAKQKTTEYTQQLIKETQTQYKQALEEFQKRKALKLQSQFEQSNKL